LLIDYDKEILNSVKQKGAYIEIRFRKK